MTTIILDSHKAFNLMIEKGIPKEQAEGVIAAIQEINISGAASKEDVATFKSELKGDIHELRVELKKDIAEVRTEMAEMKASLMKFMMVNSLTIITLTVALLKLL